ncbi:MAG: hypothetical protein AVDCRST_MAG30-1262, partial [uncultured Solirubrobacteraceae bacterium]
ALAHAAHPGSRGQRPARRDHRLRRRVRRGRPARRGHLERGHAPPRAVRLLRRAAQLDAAAPPPGPDRGARRLHGRRRSPRRPRGRLPRDGPRPRLARGPAARGALQRDARPPRGGAPPRRLRRAARPGAGARPPRAGPPRRGQPGPHRDPPAARGDDRRRAGRPARRAARDQDAGQPGDGRAPHARPPAAPDRARRPRARRRAGLPGHRLRRPRADQGDLRAPRRPAAAHQRAAARHLPDHAGEPVEHRAARRRAHGHRDAVVRRLHRPAHHGRRRRLHAGLLAERGAAGPPGRPRPLGHARARAARGRRLLHLLPPGRRDDHRADPGGL